MKTFSGSGMFVACVLAVVIFTGCATPIADAVGASYDLRYMATLLPAEGKARVSIEVRQQESLLHSADFAVDAERVELIAADGSTEFANGRLQWRPPAGGGALTLKIEVDHRRDDKAYDARMTETWALFRTDDLFPPARTVTAPGAVSRAWLRIDAPADWSVVTAYGRGSGEWLAVDNPLRRFDRPTGWIAAGQLGVRVDHIADTEVIVAAPRGEQMRRNDILALLRWTLPEITQVFGSIPSPLTIVGAGDPMWRGGLSAATSLYIHSSRPLISENGTSTLLHEVLHIAIGRRGDDWLVEGLAEYYALEALVRSGSISQERYQAAHRQLQNWAREADKLALERSSGAQTALAVTLLAELNTRVQRGTGAQRSLDDVVKQLSGHKLNLTELMRAARRVTDEPLGDLERRMRSLVG